MEKICPAFDRGNIPVVFAADNNYVDYVKVMLHSLIKNTNDENNYDLIFFNRNITKDNQTSIINMARNYKNISIRFIDINPIIKNLELKLVNYYTEEIYFRLFMPYILKEYDKAIYLDCDLILCDDIAKLANENIGDNLIAAVRDIGIIVRFYGKFDIPKGYFSKCLQKVNIDNYFNSGVLLFNLKEFRKVYTKKDVVKLLKRKKWHFPDQDMLNILCADRTKILASSWNVVPEATKIRTIENICTYVPKEYSKEYVESRRKPRIIHFAMKEKPWKYTRKLDPELYEAFWSTAAETDSFKKLIEELAKKYDLSEAYSIYTRYFDKKNLEEIKTESNISYILEDIEFGNMENFITEYDNAELKKDSMLLEGNIKLIDIIDFKQLKVYLKINGELKECETFIDTNKETTEELINNVYLRFKANIDLEIRDKIDITIYIRYKGVLIKLKNVKCGEYFMLDNEYENQYCYNKGRIFTINENIIHIQKATKIQVIKKEIKFLKYLKRKNTVWANKGIIVRLIYHLLKTFKKKTIWVIADNPLADDNGIAFFKYLKSKKDKRCKVYFVMSKYNSKYKEIKKMGNVIPYESDIYKFLILLADYILDSIISRTVRNPFREENHAYKDILSKHKFIFLQHGITINNVTKEHNKYRYFPKGFVVAARPEYDSMLSYNYYYKPEEVWLTGFPRFDYLYNEPKKYITIMPTWRKTLYSGDIENHVISDFIESDYYKYYNALLNNEKLHNKLEEKGYKLCLCIHPNFKKAVSLFENKYNNIIFTEEKYKDVYAWSNLIITDYSSAIFDFLYLRKPIIYTQFDKEKFFSSHICTKGYLDYEKDGFGEVEYNLDNTVNRIIEYVEDDCKLKEKYRRRIDKFFAYNDKNNCKRIYEKIIELEKKVYAKIHV